LADLSKTDGVGPDIDVRAVDEVLGVKEMRVKVWYFEPGGEIGHHAHPKQEELYYILEEKLSLNLGDSGEEETVEAGPGTFLVTFPRLSGVAFSRVVRVCFVAVVPVSGVSVFATVGSASGTRTSSYTLSVNERRRTRTILRVESDGCDENAISQRPIGLAYDIGITGRVDYTLSKGCPSARCI